MVLEPDDITFGAWLDVYIVDNVHLICMPSMLLALVDQAVAPRETLPGKTSRTSLMR